MNIIELQDNLKNFSQDQLIKEMQMPSGQVPQFLVLGELDRRKKMMAEMQAQKANQPTVAEEAIASAGMPQPEMRQMARSMAPKSSIAQNDGVQQMSDGGVVKMLRGGAVSARPDGQGGYILVQDGQRISDRRFPNFSEANAAVRALRQADAQPFQVDRILSGFETLGPAVEGAPSGIASIDPDPMAYAASDPTRRSLQQRQAAGTREDPSVGGISSIEPLGRRFMDEYRANMSEASAPATESMPAPQVFDATVPASSSELIDTSIEDLTRTTPNIRGNDGSSEQLELGIDPTSSRDAPMSFIDLAQQYAGIKDETTRPEINSDSITSRLSREGPETAALRKRKTSDENRIPDVDFADPTMVPDPSFRNPPDVQEKRDITPTTKVGELGSYLANLPTSISAGSGVGALLSAQETEEQIPAAIAAKQDDDVTPPATTTSGIEEFVEAEKLRPFTPAKTTTTGDDDTPKLPSASKSGMSDLESEIAQMLKDREKSAEQDKWMALAQTGLALMASKQPTLGGALGEAGMAGLKDLRRSKSDYQKDKLSLMTLQQRMEQARMTNDRLAAAANRKSVPKPKTASELNAALDYFRGIATEQATIKSVDPVTGEEITKRDDSRISDDVKEILFDLEEQYKTMFNPARDMTGS